MPSTTRSLPIAKPLNQMRETGICPISISPGTIETAPMNSAQPYRESYIQPEGSICALVCISMAITELPCLWRFSFHSMEEFPPLLTGSAVAGISDSASEKLVDRPPGVRERASWRRIAHSLMRDPEFLKSARVRRSGATRPICRHRQSNPSSLRIAWVLSRIWSQTMKASSRRFCDTDCSTAGPVVSSVPSARMFGQRFA